MTAKNEADSMSHDMAPEETRPRGKSLPKPCFLLARPRSGTTVFNRMLGTHPKIVCMGEIFNEANERSYFHYLAGLNAEDPRSVFPGKAVANFTRFLETCKQYALEKKPGCRIVVLDVKYDQAHLLCEPWWRIGNLPRLFFLIREKKWKIIDIHRRDLASLCVSNQVAIQTKIYHSTALEQGQKQTARVNIRPDTFLRDVKSTKSVYDMIVQHFCGGSHYTTIFYEEMFDEDGNFSGEMLEGISTFLGVRNVFDPAPRLQKLLSEDIFAYVENAEEIRQIILENAK
jgi:hypothetical protein